MPLKKLSQWLVIAGTLLIWAIKWVIRPLHWYDPSLKLLVGVAPNLLGSFLIPFGACWIASVRPWRWARLFQVQTAAELKAICLVGFVLLVINEYLQLIPLFGRTFDYLDILFSAVGLAAAYLVYGRLLARQAIRYDAEY
ncbi:MAG TPA: hypothetical protein VG870_01030 [Chitinophagaceae bacterium]|nr:hypothetical protein [Chitinophagaceae bacterium]